MHVYLPFILNFHSTLQFSLETAMIRCVLNIEFSSYAYEAG